MNSCILWNLNQVLVLTTKSKVCNFGHFTRQWPQVFADMSNNTKTVIFLDVTIGKAAFIWKYLEALPPGELEGSTQYKRTVLVNR